MSKQKKSKRQLIRDKKRAKKRLKEENVHLAKRRRIEENEQAAYDNKTANFIPLEDVNSGDYEGEEPPRKRKICANHGNNMYDIGDDDYDGPIKREFFGMLTDEEQEYFRRGDEMLEINQFPSDEDRQIFLQNIYSEAKGKELKLASSQSCSRLMERLILLADARQKKLLFEAFAGHFLTLVRHRFASHCCEKLFVQSAQLVTDDLGGREKQAQEQETATGVADGEEKPLVSMEELFLLTLDELEGHLTYLMSDRFASHALRVLLLVLSGRSFDEVPTKLLLQSKKKEHICVQGAPKRVGDQVAQKRAVPRSFTLATKKIIADSTSKLDSTSLRVLAKHPTANPVLQLLLELDITLTTKAKRNSKEQRDDAHAEDGESNKTLLEKLLPDAPYSLSDPSSPASDLIGTLLYDPIGSRLVEALITHCPGKIFKGIYTHLISKRIHNLLRNETAMYPAIRAVNRLSKQDLAEAVRKCLPEVPNFVEKARFNVLRTLFERCHVREAAEELEALLKALTTACDGDWKRLIPRLCFLGGSKKNAEPEQNFQQDVPKNQNVLVTHGSKLVIAILGIPGSCRKAIQASLLSLKRDELDHLANFSNPTSTILLKALTTPSHNLNFHKLLFAPLVPHIMKLANSRQGHNVLVALVTIPSKGTQGLTLPFHVKENIMAQLASGESALRETWHGRSVWRAWKGDLYKRRQGDWVKWAKEVDPEEKRMAAMPVLKAEKRAEGENEKRDHKGKKIGKDGGDKHR